MRPDLHGVVRPGGGLFRQLGLAILGGGQGGLEFTIAFVKLLDARVGFELALGYGLVVAGMFVPDLDSRGIAAVWGSIVVTAVVVAALEEFLFRGGMLSLLLRSAGPTTALLVVSALFAVVHFLEAPKEFSIERHEVTWSSGFVLLGRMLGHLADVRIVVAELLLLFLVGVVLASVRLRSRSLWLPMGLHAGWVFGIQLYSAITDPSRRLGRGELLPWMGDDLKVGVFPLLVVALTWWAALRFLRSEQRRKGVR